MKWEKITVSRSIKGSSAKKIYIYIREKRMDLHIGREILRTAQIDPQDKINLYIDENKKYFQIKKENDETYSRRLSKSANSPHLFITTFPSDNLVLQNFQVLSEEIEYGDGLLIFKIPEVKE